MSKFNKLVRLLTPKDRKIAILLMAMVLIMAILETLGLISILPFMAVLANPEIVETNTYLKKIFELSKNLGVENQRHFLFILGVFVFLMLVISLSFKALTVYVQVLFNALCRYNLERRMIEGYLNQPYSWFLSRNSSDLGRNILDEVGTVISTGVGPMMDLISRIVVSATIITLLIIVDPMLTLVVSLTLGLVYALIYFLSNNFIKNLGQSRLNANKKKFKAISEAFGAIKEIKIGGIENIYINRYSKPARKVTKNQASFSVLTLLPRYALEIVAFGGIILLVLYLMAKTNNFVNAVPIIALYVYAGYRLMPLLQGIYNSAAQLQFVGPALDSLHSELSKFEKSNVDTSKNNINLMRNISLKNISFQYPNSSKIILNDINLNISAQTSIGIVGVTGSGKTTIVDIILGLLEAQKGNLKIDDQVIDKDNIRAWQRSIGYVPQHIYLADDTIAANIAFGENPKLINHEAVERAAKIACIHEFITNELPLKYMTEVGERGIRLSGGQLQRIGIARALYRAPQILILDEPTSALDNLTEQAIMESLNKMRSDLTIIMITHRIDTVKKLDNIIFIEKGKIKGQGTYNELINKNINLIGKKEKNEINK